MRTDFFLKSKLWKTHLIKLFSIVCVCVFVCVGAHIPPCFLLSFFYHLLFLMKLMSVFVWTEYVWCLFQFTFIHPSLDQRESFQLFVCFLRSSSYDVSCLFILLKRCSVYFRPYVCLLLSTHIYPYERQNNNLVLTIKCYFLCSSLLIFLNLKLILGAILGGCNQMLV